LRSLAGRDLPLMILKLTRPMTRYDRTFFLAVAASVAGAAIAPWMVADRQMGASASGRSLTWLCARVCVYGGVVVVVLGAVQRAGRRAATERRACALSSS
jgi:hypothetical protein